MPRSRRAPPGLRAGWRKVLTLCDDGVGRLVESDRVRFQLVGQVPESPQPEPPPAPEPVAENRDGSSGS